VGGKNSFIQMRVEQQRRAKRMQRCAGWGDFEGRRNIYCRTDTTVSVDTEIEPGTIGLLWMCRVMEKQKSTPAIQC
jgi:hypothetical protein